MSLLQKLIEQEQARRATEEARTEGIAAEHQAAVKALHGAFKPYEPEVAAMLLRGDYGKTIRQGERQASVYHQFVSATKGLYCGPHGIIVALAMSGAIERTLSLAVSPRSDTAPLRVTLTKTCGYTHDKVREFAHPFGAELVVEALLAELVKEIAP